MPKYTINHTTITIFFFLILFLGMIIGSIITIYENVNYQCEKYINLTNCVCFDINNKINGTFDGVIIKNG